jgi:toxin-antitoxin system PIN domain toxin
MKKGYSDLLLLDVNVLLALAWPNHQFHRAAYRRMDGSSSQWAACAITELGFIRLSPNPTVISSPKTASQAAALLSQLVSDPIHVFLPEIPSPCGSGFRSMLGPLSGHRQVTDFYLIWLARTNRATLVTSPS